MKDGTFERKVDNTSRDINVILQTRYETRTLHRGGTTSGMQSAYRIGVGERNRQNELKLECGFRDQTSLQLHIDTSIEICVRIVNDD